MLLPHKPMYFLFCSWDAPCPSGLVSGLTERPPRGKGAVFRTLQRASSSEKTWCIFHLLPGGFSKSFTNILLPTPLEQALPICSAAEWIQGRMGEAGAQVGESSAAPFRLRCGSCGAGSTRGTQQPYAGRSSSWAHRHTAQASRPSSAKGCCGASNHEYWQQWSRGKKKRAPRPLF